MIENLHLRVDKSNARTAREEHDHLEEMMWKIGNFFACDVHPTKLKTALISRDRIFWKMVELRKSDEYEFD